MLYVLAISYQGIWIVKKGVIFLIYALTIEEKKLYVYLSTIYELSEDFKKNPKIYYMDTIFCIFKPLYIKVYRITCVHIELNDRTQINKGLPHTCFRLIVFVYATMYLCNQWYNNNSDIKYKMYIVTDWNCFLYVPYGFLQIACTCMHSGIKKWSSQSCRRR